MKVQYPKLSILTPPRHPVLYAVGCCLHVPEVEQLATLGSGLRSGLRLMVYTSAMAASLDGTEHSVSEQSTTSTLPLETVRMSVASPA